MHRHRLLSIDPERPAERLFSLRAMFKRLMERRQQRQCGRFSRHVPQRLIESHRTFGGLDALLLPSRRPAERSQAEA